MERFDTICGHAIIWLSLAFIVGLILLKQASGAEWLLALAAARWR
jgi:hypothetical protein